MGDVPFSVYYDFETTTSGVFFDAKMYVVSYCLVVAFHPDLNFPRPCIHRSYDLSQDKLTSLSHFEAVKYNVFSNKLNYNRTTLKQLEEAAFLVQNREADTALAEMFSIELKFAVDCLKSWFNRNHKVLEISVQDKANFVKDNPKKKDTLCCLCDFPIESRAINGWSEHVFKAEYLFLENIYTEKEMKIMGVTNFEIYCKKLNKTLDELDSFCSSIESENLSSTKTDEEILDIKAIIQKISLIKTKKEDYGKATKEKTIGFLYSHEIKFLKTDKVKGDFLMSVKFLPNMISIQKNQSVIHHLHVTGKINGFANEYCNLQTRGNYYTIPVFAHNQFRFDFFLFLKGFRPSVRETTNIGIGGSNLGDVNFAIIKNQVRFIDTVKYFKFSYVKFRKPCRQHD